MRIKNSFFSRPVGQSSKVQFPTFCGQN